MKLPRPTVLASARTLLRLVAVAVPSFFARSAGAEGVHADALLGVAASAIGTGTEVGIEVTYRGEYLAAGLAPRWTTVSSDTKSYSAVALPALAFVRFPERSPVWVGVGLELGPQVERINTELAGRTDSANRVSLFVGLGLRLTMALGGGWEAAVLGAARGASSTNTESRAVFTDQGSGPAPPDAGSGFGGVTLVAAMAIGSSFLRMRQAETVRRRRRFP